MISVDEFHRMLDTGMFDDDERVELLDGVATLQIRPTPWRAIVIQRLITELVLQEGDERTVLPRLPLTLSDRSEPMPDASIVRRADGGSKDHHPTTALLVAEVSEATLERDRTIKAAIYARAGIPEYWIANVREECVEVYRDPDAEAGRYRSLVTLGRHQVLRPVGLSGVAIPLAELFA